jgi:hypothetical protein
MREESSNIEAAKNVFIKFARSQEDSEKVRYFLDGMDLLADEGSPVAVRMMETHSRELGKQMPSSLSAIVEGLEGKKHSWLRENVDPEDLSKANMLLKVLADLDDEVFDRVLKGVIHEIRRRSPATDASSALHRPA